MMDPCSLVGKEIDHFRLNRFIAKGGMGMVYEATDSVLNRTIALKLIPKCHDSSREVVEAARRLKLEAKAAGGLSHPNIVIIHSYGETDEFQYICMEHVVGNTLSLVIEEQGKIPIHEAIALIEQVLLALEAANQLKIVHRDIKPANIMVMRDGRVKVMDFGIAKHAASPMTIPGTILGTVFYMSPEQIQGHKVDVRSDLFSVGVVLYEALTGERPFKGNLVSVTRQILYFNPPPANLLNPLIPSPVSRVIDKALSKDPNQRYGSPAEMLDDLLKSVDRATAREGQPSNISAALVPLKLEIIAPSTREKGDQETTIPLVSSPVTRSRRIPGPRGLILALVSLLMAAAAAASYYVYYVPPSHPAKSVPGGERASTSKEEVVPTHSIAQGHSADDGSDRAFLNQQRPTPQKPLESSPNGQETERNSHLETLVVARPALWKDPVTGMEFLWVAGGCFLMGSGPNERGRTDTEGPVHRVCVSGFWMGKTEVSRGQFRSFAAATGYKTEAEKRKWAYALEDKYEKKKVQDWLKAGFEQDDRHPVVNVSWNDAKAMTTWLSSHGNGKFRLPTEAEWEYGCRSGKYTARFWGDDPNGACRYANVADESIRNPARRGEVHRCDDRYTHTAPVGNYDPNAFGIHDLLGNVTEWCEDVYHQRAYEMHSTDNPFIREGGQEHVIRGCGWGHIPDDVRCATRGRAEPSDRSNDLGFRLVKVP
jgi:formylglycine-generating enzyme